MAGRHKRQPVSSDHRGWGPSSRQQASIGAGEGAQVWSPGLAPLSQAASPLDQVRGAALPMGRWNIRDRDRRSPRSWALAPV